MYWFGQLAGAALACILFTQIFFFVTRNSIPMSARKIVATYVGFAIVASLIYTLNSLGGGNTVAIVQQAILGYGTAAVVIGLAHFVVYRSRRNGA